MSSLNKLTELAFFFFKCIYHYGDILFMCLMNACRTIFYAEYNCSGPGASVNMRAPYVQRLNDTQAFPFLNTTFIDGDLWLET
jgi:hypothetical protein